MSLSLGLIFSATVQHPRRGGAADRAVQRPAGPAERLRLPDRATCPCRAAVVHGAVPGDALHPREPRHLPARRGAARRCCPSCCCSRSSPSGWWCWRGARWRRAHDGGSPHGSNILAVAYRESAGAAARQGLHHHRDGRSRSMMLLLFGCGISYTPANVPWAVLDRSDSGRRRAASSRISRRTGYFLAAGRRSELRRGPTAAPARATRWRVLVIPQDFRARHRARPTAGAAPAGRHRPDHGGARARHT